MGKEGRGRKAAGGRGERGRAAGGRGGRGGGGGGLPRLLASVRPALARPLLAEAPRLASAARSGRASSRPSGRRSASPFLLRLRLLPHKYQLLTPSPDLAAAAAATLRSSSASRDFRTGLGPPRLAPTRPLALSLLLLCQSVFPFAALALPTPQGSSQIGEGPRARWLGPRRVTSARRGGRAAPTLRCNSSETRRPGPRPHSGAGRSRCFRRLESR